MYLRELDLKKEQGEIQHTLFDQTQREVDQEFEDLQKQLASYDQLVSRKEGKEMHHSVL